MIEADDGMLNGSDVNIDTALAICAFVAIAIYNVIELTVIIFSTFKRRAGLYFWSFCVSTWAILPYGLGFLIKALQVTTHSYVFVTMIVLGWSGMVTGQSVVLYSRLHLVDRNTTRLRMVLCMIVVNAVICHIPIAVMIYGVNSSNPVMWVKPYSIYEKVQVTIFFVQELIISGLYIAATVSFFRFEAALGGKSAKHMMRHLILVNVVIIILDITILGLEYAGFYALQTAYKALVYSVKLKMEFKILNSLIDLTKNRGGSHEHGYRHSSSRGERSNPGLTGTAVGTIVGLSTIDRKRGPKSSRRRDSDARAPPVGGYKAYVQGGTGGDAPDNQTSPSDGGIMVMRTTEINVVSDRCKDADGEHSQKDRSDGETERDSIDITMDGKRVKSASSSEIEFARNGL